MVITGLPKAHDGECSPLNANFVKLKFKLKFF